MTHDLLQFLLKHRLISKVLELLFYLADPFSLPAASMNKLRAMVADRAFDRQATLLLGPAAFNAGPCPPNWKKLTYNVCPGWLSPR